MPLAGESGTAFPAGFQPLRMGHQCGRAASELLANFGILRILRPFDLGCLYHRGGTELPAALMYADPPVVTAAIPTKIPK